MPQNVKLARNPFSSSVGITDGPFLSSNPRRWAVLVSAVVPLDTPFVSDNTLTSAADTSTTGVKSSYTVPTGVQASLTSATQFETAGTGVVSSLQIVRAGVTYTITNVTTNGQWTGRIPLQAGDVIRWNVTTAVVASTADYTINVERERVPARVTLSFGGPAVLDSGVNVYSGTLPLLLTYNDFG